MMQLFSTSHYETVPERMFPNPVPRSFSTTLTLKSSLKGHVLNNHTIETEPDLLVKVCTKPSGVDVSPSFPVHKLETFVLLKE